METFNFGGRKRLFAVTGIAENPGHLGDFIDGGDVSGAELMEEFGGSLFWRTLVATPGKKAEKLRVEVVCGRKFSRVWPG